MATKRSSQTETPRRSDSRNSRKSEGKEYRGKGSAFDSPEVDVCEQTGKFNLLGPKFTPATAAQGQLYKQLKGKQPYVVAEGPAGVGKTYVEVSFALEEMAAGRIDQIVITRPAQEVDGEDMGFLPGELHDKFEPYLTPILDIMREQVNEGTLKYLRSRNKIVAVPIGFMRGRTFKNAIVIVDEAQNTTPKQMKMIVTRLGAGSKMVLNGDLTQKDIGGDSGLADAIRRLVGTGLVGRVKFDKSDSVRTGFMAAILEAYED